jgi:hypothetical protein
MFFPDPEDEKNVPIHPLMIFNATWPAEECPTGDTKRHNTFCDKIVSRDGVEIEDFTTYLFAVFQVYNNFEPK